MLTLFEGCRLLSAGREVRDDEAEMWSASDDLREFCKGVLITAKLLPLSIYMPYMPSPVACYALISSDFRAFGPLARLYKPFLLPSFSLSGNASSELDIEMKLFGN